MKHWFLDTNVAMDFLADRQPFAQDADKIFRLAYAQQIRLYAASLSFSHISYLLRRSHGATPARRMLVDLQQLIDVVAVAATTVQLALTSGLLGFEDALQYHAATAVPAIEAIITRDPKGFQTSALPVPTPSAALRQAR